MLRMMRRAGAELRRRHAVLCHGDGARDHGNAPRDDGRRPAALCRGPARASERGYSVLEAAITVPILFFLLMAVVQWAIVWHSRNIAQAAAQEALRAAVSYGSSSAAGQQDGRDYLSKISPNIVKPDCLNVTPGTTTMTVTVHCEVLSVVPFGHYWVDEQVSGPVERFVNGS